MSSILKTMGLKPKVMQPLEYGPYMEATKDYDIEYENHISTLENEDGQLQYAAQPIDLVERHRLASKHLSLRNFALYDNGAFGSIYTANDKLGRVFAVKCINPKYDTKEYINNIYLPRVFREVYCLSNLRHENVVKFYKYRFISSQYHTAIKMEKLGPNLAILSNEAWTLTNFRKLVKQLSSVLNYMHDKSIAHHDVKMENIMASKPVYEFAFGASLHRQLENVDFKIGDFGSAHHYPIAPVEISFRSGTSYYRSPEKMFNASYDPMAADNFAMGVCLLTAFVGGDAVREITDSEDRTDRSRYDLEGNPRMHNIAMHLMYTSKIRIPRDFIDDRTIIAELLGPQNERPTAEDIFDWYM